MSVRRVPVAIVGATGMVGQRFVSLLAYHPWFDVKCLAASPRSADRPYREAVEGRWMMAEPLPSRFAEMKVLGAERDRERIAKEVELIFSAIDLSKDETATLETEYAKAGVMVVSNNSAHRWTADVPIILPEINPDHLELVRLQRRNRGWERGGIVVKPNCSIQSYVPVLSALRKFEPLQAVITTAQAVSGAGKTVESWPEMQDNVIPFIKGEEEKSEREPLKVWGTFSDGGLSLATTPVINATCLRVPVSDGHLASCSVKFKQAPSHDEFVAALQNFEVPSLVRGLPSAPKQFLTYLVEDDRPQTKLDRMVGNGMGISVGRLRRDKILDWSFIALSHNTLRGAAGGAVLTAELVVAAGI